MQGGEFTGGSIPNVLSFAFSDVQPPSRIYIQRDDLLYVTGTTLHVGGDTITVTVRLLLPQAPTSGQPNSPAPSQQGAAASIGPGNIQTIQYTIALPIAPLRASVIIPLAEGYLLSVACSAKNSTEIGESFVTGYLGRSPQAGQVPQPTQVLFSDYVSTARPAGWPTPYTRQPAYGQAQLTSIVIAAPGAGTDWIYTVPGGTQLRIHTLHATFASAVAVASRHVRILFEDDAANIIGVYGAGASQTASTTYGYTGARGLVIQVDVAVPIQAQFPLPTMDLKAGWVIASMTSGIQAADAWTAITLGVEQMIF